MHNKTHREAGLELLLGQYTSPETQRAYSGTVRGLENWLAANGFEVCTAPTGLSYMHYCLHERKMAASTWRRTQTLLKSFYNFLNENWPERFQTNPWKMKFTGRTVIGGNKEEMLVPLDKVASIIAKATTDQERCILGFAFGCALRISEALAVTKEDIRFEPVRHIRLHETKSGVPQTVVITDWAWRLIKPTWTATKPGKRLLQISQETLQKSWKRCLVRSNVTGCTFHAGRATAITRLLADGVDYHSVSRFARHASLAQTAQYDRRRLDLEGSAGLKLTYK